ncbi:MAG TPA: hypothetical protein DCE42_24635 [Myxococcales bacterium]|nr:hypothetical protein [Myxococcales bacterium]
MAGGLRKGKSTLRFWDMKYVKGGREVIQSLGQEAILGQNFAFLGPNWGDTPLVASILQAAGARRPPAALFPLWGDGWCELPGVSLRQRPVPSWGATGIWCEKQQYRAGLDAVKAVVFAPQRAGKMLEVALSHDGLAMGNQPIPIDEVGVGYVMLQGLPPGRFQLALADGSASTSFQVAIERTETLSGTWIQQYLRDTGMGRMVFVFVLKLESFGAPLRGDVGVNLLDGGQHPISPVSGEVFRADGGGRIAGELPIAGEGPFLLEIRSLTDELRHCVLPIPLEHEDLEDDAPLLSEPFGRAKSWSWVGGAPDAILGFSTQDHEGGGHAPFLIEEHRQDGVVLQSQAVFSEVNAMIMDPLRGSLVIHRQAELAPEALWTLPLNGPVSVMALGGFVNGRPWEGWFLAATKPNHSLSLSVPEMVEPGEEVEIKLSSNVERETPVYIVVREQGEEDPEPWGPSQSLKQNLRAMTKDFQLAFADDPLGAAQPKPFHFHDDKAPVDSSASLEERADGWRPPPPSLDEFSQVLYNEVVRLKGVETLRISVPAEIASYEVDAVLLEEDGWVYAKEHFDVTSGCFLEILSPSFVHADDGMLGKIVLLVETLPCRVSCWLDGTPVELYDNGRKLAFDEFLEERVLELSFSVMPGHYVVKVFDRDEQEIDTLEHWVGGWGERTEQHHTLCWLETGAQLSDEQGPFVPLGRLEPWIRQVARHVALMPPGNCEQEAARVRASMAWVECAQSREDAEKGMHFLRLGLERLEALMLPRGGFRYLPGADHLPTFGMDAVRHLWEVALPGRADSHQALAMWFRDVVHMADEASKGYQLNKLPARMLSCRDAFRVFCLEDISSRQKEALWECEKRLSEQSGQLMVWGEHVVESRQESCYAAATLLLSDDVEHQEKGGRVVSAIFSQLGTEGQLYTTTDNVALLALLQVCVSRLHPEATVRSDGEDSPWRELVFMPFLDNVEVLQGPICVATSQRVTRSLERFSERIPCQLSLHRVVGEREWVDEVNVGERLQLTIELPSGSQPGDLLELYLPHALTCLDAAGDDEPHVFVLQPCERIQLPIAVTETTVGVDGDVGPQHWGIRLRNLYREERGFASFRHTITVWPHGHRKRRWNDPLKQGWRKIFG